MLPMTSAGGGGREDRATIFLRIVAIVVSISTRIPLAGDSRRHHDGGSLPQSSSAVQGSSW